MKIHWFFKVLLTIALIFLIWLVFYFGLPRILPQQILNNQEIYGIILSDQVWEGDIRITGDIFSPTNSTITVLPGTRIRVATSGDKSNMDYLPWHLKNGVNTGEESRGVKTGEPFWDASQRIYIDLNNLIIQGTFSEPVTFTSDTDHVTPFDFNTISIRSGNIRQGLFSGYRKFEVGSDVTISDSVFRSTAECAVCSYYGKPEIINNSFEDSLRDSIFVDRASPEISGNLFRNPIGQGIKIDARRLSAAHITDNDFEMPEQTALDIISGGQLDEILVARNVFSGNTKIRIACDGKVRIRDNIILGQVGFTSGCSGGFTFGPNYWGTPDMASILREKITTKYDNYKIDVSNVLIIPPKDAGRK